MRDRFRRSEDPLILSRLYISSSENLQEIFYSETPFALGFMTRLGLSFLSRHECAEMFIDSTYKTNSLKLELFSVITTVFGTGFPVAYLFLQSSLGFGVRQGVLYSFLCAQRQRIANFKPKVFFTDKDRGQMNAIRNALDLDPSICYWHVKRAIRFKIRELKKTRPLSIPDDVYKQVMSLISKHWNQHPMFFGNCSVETIRRSALHDFRFLISGSDLAD